jgi:hypothetical protein
LALLETEHDNLRAALDWGLSAPEPQRGRRLAAALPRLWILYGHAHEGIEHLKRAIALAPDDRTDLRQGLDIATAIGDDRTRGRCLNVEAYIYMYRDDATARRLCVEACRYTEAAGDEWGTDVSLVLEAVALTNGDRHEEARPVLDTAVERCRRHGDRLLLAFALGGQVYRALLTGDPPRRVGWPPRRSGGHARWPTTSASGPATSRGSWASAATSTQG